MAVAYKKFIVFVSVLQVVLIQNSVSAQITGGYNYGPPTDITNAANIQSKTATPALRPIVAAYPTGSTSVGIVPNFPTVSSGFAGTPNVFNTAYGATGVGATAQGTGLGYTPSASAASLAKNTGVYAGQTTTTGLNQKTNTLQQQRSNDVGIYRGNSANVGITRGTSVPTGLEQDYDGDFSAIPGLPGVNYPVYSQVPQTNFDCAQQPLPGYYSDVEAQCQVFHICALNRTYSFLCPNGTIFSQETLVCVWWNQFDCATAPPLYPNNAFIYDYGNDRTAATSAVYSQTGTPQLASGSTNRQQGNFQVASTIRTPTSNIYGSSNIRPTVGPNSFTSPVQASSFSQTGGIAQMSSGRFAQTPPTATAQTFPTGAVLRGGGTNLEGQKNNRFSGLQEVAYANSPIASSSTNREYLPPGRA